MILILQIIGIFLSLGFFWGIIMYWSTINFAGVFIPLSLLIMSLSPILKKKYYPFIIILVITLSTLSYTLTGIPFLDTQDDIVARFLHFSGFLLILIFVCNLLFIYIKEKRTK